MGYSNTDKIFRSVRNLVNYENQKGCQKEQDRVVESFLYISEMNMYTDDLVHEYEIYGITYRSEAMMNTFLFTGKYLPLPHPTSSPTEPGDKF